MKETRFKETEIGKIPREWDVCLVGDAFKRLNSNTLSRDCLNYKDGTIKNIHYGDILTKFGEYVDVNKADIPYLNPEISIAVSSKNKLQDNDVIFADTAEDEVVGKAVQLVNVNDSTVVSGLHTIVLRPNDRIFAPKYLGYFFNTSFYHNQLFPYMQGIKVLSVSKKAIDSTYLFYPKDLAEQKRIAEALSEIDSLISQIGKLIEKKRVIKQGAMEQLLTGKKRIKGFSEAWIEKKLGEIGVLTKQSINPLMFPNTLFSEFSMPAFDNGQSPVFKYGNEMFSNRTVIDGETLLYNKLNVRQKRIWLVKDCGQESICSAEFLAYKSNNINLDLLKYILSTNRVTKNFIDMSKGTSNSQKRIQPTDFLDYSIGYPKSGKEQKAIASILSSMDEEISSLETKREKYIAIKQGMMQQLLSGRIRLK